MWSSIPMLVAVVLLAVLHVPLTSSQVVETINLSVAQGDSDLGARIVCSGNFTEELTVEYWLPSDPGTISSASAFPSPLPTPFIEQSTTFKLMLRNLEKDSLYTYVVKCAPSSAPQNFDLSTRAQNSGYFYVGVLGNLRELDAGQAPVPISVIINAVQESLGNTSTLLVFPGFYSPGLRSLNSWRPINFFTARYPFAVAPGYMDYTENYRTYNLWINDELSTSGSPLYYSFNYTKVHIISMCTETDFHSGSQQYQWMESDLMAANQYRDEFPWIMVITESPFYSDYGNNVYLQTEIEPLLHKYGVDFVVSNGRLARASKPAYKNVFDFAGSNDECEQTKQSPLVNPGIIHILGGTLNNGPSKPPQTIPFDKLLWQRVFEEGFMNMNFSTKLGGSVDLVFQSLTRCTYLRTTRYPSDIACARNCSSHGYCSDQFFKCVCNDNWSGFDCSVPAVENYIVPQFTEWKTLSAESQLEQLDWTQVQFNDSDWASANLPIGGDTSDQSRLISEIPITSPELSGLFLYTRKIFEFSDLPQKSEGNWTSQLLLLLSLNSTHEIGDHRFFLNGQLVPITRLVSEDYVPYWSHGAIMDQATDLNEGENILAIEIPVSNNASQFFVSVCLRAFDTCQPGLAGFGCNETKIEANITAPTEFPFTDTTTAPAKTSEDGSNVVGIILGVVIPIVVIALLVSAIVFVIFFRRSRRQAYRDFFHTHAASIESNDWFINYNELQFGQELGRGAFGVVFAAKWRGADCVVKQLQVHSEEAKEEFIQEMTNMKKLRPHANVCAFLGGCTEPPCIVTELITDGSLTDALASGRIILDSELHLQIAIEVSSAMVHLHAESVLHCDLAARNLLVSLKEEGRVTIKLCDFGLSHVVDTGTYDATGDTKFPIRWVAPEVMTKRQLSKASDVWSFGVTMWEIMESSRPFPELSNKEVIEQVCYEGLRLQKPTKVFVQDEVWNIIAKSFATEPEDRPTFQQLCAEFKAVAKRKGFDVMEEIELVSIPNLQGGEDHDYEELHATTTQVEQQQEEGNYKRLQGNV